MTVLFRIFRRGVDQIGKYAIPEPDGNTAWRRGISNENIGWVKQELPHDAIHRLGIHRAGKVECLPARNFNETTIAAFIAALGADATGKLSCTIGPNNYSPAIAGLLRIGMNGGTRFD